MLKSVMKQSCWS